MQACTNGHEMTPDNVYIRPGGRRGCRICRRIQNAAWGRVNRATRRAWEQANAAAKQRRQHGRYSVYRAQVFAHYGESCACCGSTERLEIDHIHGGGRAHRIEVFGHPASSSEFYRWLIKQGFPAGYQTLCARCNRSKGTGERCILAHDGRQSRAWLTEADVRTIRARCAAGETRAAVASAYGIDPSTVSLIARHLSWAHVADLEGSLP